MLFGIHCSLRNYTPDYLHPAYQSSARYTSYALVFTIELFHKYNHEVFDLLYNRLLSKKRFSNLLNTIGESQVIIVILGSPIIQRQSEVTE